MHATSAGVANVKAKKGGGDLYTLKWNRFIQYGMQPNRHGAIRAHVIVPVLARVLHSADIPTAHARLPEMSYADDWLRADTATTQITPRWRGPAYTNLLHNQQLEQQTTGLLRSHCCGSGPHDYNMSPFAVSAAVFVSTWVEWSQ
ncbi:hypothetical protein J6590_049005 [Homalodisca vitripennis]|nr:hypothetical protein J6590_049005 [Homalodisca vitripennis]